MSEHREMEFAERVAAPLKGRERAEPDFEERLLSAVRTASGAGEVPWLAGRGAGAADAAARVGTATRRRGWGWLTDRRRLAISPLGGLALAAGFAGLVAVSTLALADRSLPLAAAGEDSAGALQVVHFALVAPHARSVTLVGDFNGWDPSLAALRQGTVPGLWSISVPLPPGSHQYAFVIDGSVWVADPAAAVTLEDELGAPSSLVTVGAGRT